MMADKINEASSTPISSCQRVNISLLMVVCCGVSTRIPSHDHRQDVARHSCSVCKIMNSQFKGNDRLCTQNNDGTLPLADCSLARIIFTRRHSVLGVVLLCTHVLLTR